jgi:VWFA-related protein
MSIRKALLLLCIAAVLAPVSTAQEFSEVLEIRVTNVDVIVTGRDGKPVTGLTRDDFELYEDGVRKELSNFLELRGEGTPSLTVVTGGAPAPTPAAQDVRRRDITVFIDDTVVPPFRRNEIFPALQEFLSRNVRDGDTVSIAVWGSSLKVELEPTMDRAAVDATVERLRKSGGFSGGSERLKDEFHQSLGMLIRSYAAQTREGGIPIRPPWILAIAEARAYAMKVSHNARQRLEALKSVIGWRKGADGRKILVMLTDAMPMNPAEDAFLFLDASRDSFENATTPAMVEANEFTVPALVEEVTRLANASGVTLYPIDAGGKDSGMVGRDASIPGRVTGSGATVMAMQTPTLRAIAEDTGGVAMTGSDNWKLALDTISNDLESYYSLGYRTEGPQQDRTKKIEVRAKDKRLKVRTRKAVIEKSLTSEMHDAVAAHLFHPASTNDLAVRASAGTAAAKDESSVVIPITVTIPMDKLTLLPDGTDLAGQVAIYAAFVRKDGAVSKVAQQQGAIRFPAESLKRRKELTLKMDVTTDAGTTGVSVGVMDEKSRVTGFVALKLN